MKTINIYIDYEDKKRLNEIHYKYHLSYSTIINIVTELYYMIIGTKIQSNYLYGKEKQKKTSIKPREINKYSKPSFIYTNATKIFCKNELDKYCEDKKLREKTNNMIYAEFQNTYEENWDGNKMTKSITKFIKKNPTYVKRILNE